MQPSLPSFAVAAAVSEARDLIPRLRSRKASLTEVLAFGRWARIAAVGKLFVDARVTWFLADLERSALALVHFLAPAGTGALAPGLAQPFFDAVASGARELAVTIARAARRDWTRGTEYEDDFLYMRYLMDLATGAERAALAPLLDRYELVLDGEVDVRLVICRALHTRDAAAFDAALRALAESLHIQYQERLEEESLDPDEAVTVALLSVEALALVQLAAGEDLTCSAEHLLAPSLARRTDLRRPLGPEDWQEIGLDGLVV